MNFIKLRCINKEKEVYHWKQVLCCFGYDLNIYSDCNINYNSNSELGDAYKRPSANEEEEPSDSEEEEQSANERYALAGFKYFKVLEMEVYKVL